MDETNPNTPEMDKGIARPAKPGLLFSAGSFTVFGVCILTVSLVMAALSRVLAPHTLTGGIFFFVPALVIGINQYRAIFRRRPESARMIGGLFFVMSLLLTLVDLTGVALCITLCIAAEVGPTTEDLIAWLLLLGILLGIAAFLYLHGIANERWAILLDQEDHDPAAPEAPPHYQLSIREMLGLMTVVALIAGLTMTILEHTRF